MSLKHSQKPSNVYSLFSPSAMRVFNTLFALCLFYTLAFAAGKSTLPTIPNSLHTDPSPAPTSFCKCTCDKNSTIIPLDAPATARPSQPSILLFLRSTENNNNDTSEDGNKYPEKEEGDTKEGEGDRKEYRPGNCNDCNKQFCLSYNLPICKGVDEEKVFTTCFRACAISQHLAFFNRRQS